MGSSKRRGKQRKGTVSTKSAEDSPVFRNPSTIFKPVSTINFDHEVFNTINYEVSLFNSGVSFLTEAQKDDTRFQQMHKRVHELYGKIELVWRNTIKELESLDEELVESSDPFRADITREAHWYQAGDLFELPHQHLEEFIQVPTKDIRDPADFGTYLLRRFSDHISNPSEDDLHPYRILQRFKYFHDMFDKARGRPLPGRGGLIFNATLLGHVLPNNRLLSNESMLNMIERAFRDMKEDLDWARGGEFFNAAAARRAVFKAYQHFECDALWRSGECFHQRSIDLLHRMQRQAHEEIRHNVLLAANGRLPTELTGALIEHILEAEEIPLAQNVRYEGNAPPELAPWAIRKELQCPRMQFWVPERHIEQINAIKQAILDRPDPKTAKKEVTY